MLLRAANEPTTADAGAGGRDDPEVGLAWEEVNFADALRAVARDFEKMLAALGGACEEGSLNARRRDASASK